MERLYETLRALLTGLPPGHIMDNGDRADPRDPIAMERVRLTGTRAKDRTSQQIDTLEDLDYIGGINSTEPGTVTIEDDQIQIEGFGNLCLTTAAVESMLLNAATMFRLGTKAKTAFLLEGPYCLLLDGKPAKVTDIFEDRLKYRIRRRVHTGTGTKRNWIVINRPLFREWSAVIDINYFPKSLDRHQVERILEGAGIYQGIGSYRPKYGRFDVEILTGPNGSPKGKRK
jgi:hypothetical protein